MVELISGERLRRSIVIRTASDGTERAIDYWLDRYQHSSKHFYDRAHSAAEAYGLGAVPDAEGRVARALILLAGEYSVVPVLEGVLAALEAVPQTPGLELSAAASALARWSADIEPALSSLVAQSLSVNGRYMPFPPLVRAFDRLVARHLSPTASRTDIAEDLAVVALHEIDLVRRGASPDAGVGRELVSRGRELGVVPHPGVEEQQHLAHSGLPAEMITAHALLQIAIEFEVGDVTEQRMHELAPIIASLASQLEGSA